MFCFSSEAEEGSCTDNLAGIKVLGFLVVVVGVVFLVAYFC